MRKIYKKPITEIVYVCTSVETMAGLDVTISNVGVDDEAAKEQTGLVEDDDELPTTPNTWSTNED